MTRDRSVEIISTGDRVILPGRRTVYRVEESAGTEGITMHRLVPERGNGRKKKDEDGMRTLMIGVTIIAVATIALMIYEFVMVT